METPPEELKTTGDFCGAEFIPSADSFLEGGIEIQEEAIEVFTEEDEKQRQEELEGLRELLKEDHGLSEDQVMEALSAGKVEGMAWCVCPKCQDAEPEEGEEWKEEE